MSGKNYNNLDLLTAGLWTSFLIGLQYGGQKPIPLKLNPLHVAKMLELREEAKFVIQELETDLEMTKLGLVKDFE